MNFQKCIILDFMCMKMKMVNTKIFAAKNFMKATCTQNYSRFYVEGKQELCPFYM